MPVSTGSHGGNQQYVDRRRPFDRGFRGYEDDDDRGDLIIYTGHQSLGKKVSNQELKAGNPPLVISEETWLSRPSGPRLQKRPPVRAGNWLPLRRSLQVKRHWHETGKSGFKVYRYELA